MFVLVCRNNFMKGDSFFLPFSGKKDKPKHLSYFTIEQNGQVVKF